MFGDKQDGNARLGSLQSRNRGDALAVVIGGVCYANGSGAARRPPSDRLGCGAMTRSRAWVWEGL